MEQSSGYTTPGVFSFMKKKLLCLVFDGLFFDHQHRFLTGLAVQHRLPITAMILHTSDLLIILSLRDNEFEDWMVRPKHRTLLRSEKCRARDEWIRSPVPEFPQFLRLF